MVALICVSTLLAMSVWFSASFVVDELRGEWALDSWQAAALTVAVQLGFVVGALAISVMGLIDRFPERHLFALSAFGAAGVNLLLLVAPNALSALGLRFATGVLMAGIYPVALAAIGTWVPPRSRAGAMGLALAALTLGSAAPHAVIAIVALDWRSVFVVTSVLTALGGLLMMVRRGDGPWRPARTRFVLREAGAILSDASIRRVVIGYMGHMWELYAMWTWIGAFLAWRLSDQVGFEGTAVIAFAVIALGAVGCAVGGVLGDRTSNVAAARGALVLSGSCAVALVFSGGWPLWLLVTVLCVWGITIVADSAQFSAIISQLSPPTLIGTALAFQLAAGFLVTAVSILLIPLVVELVGWPGAFLLLAAGPVVAVVALSWCRD